MLSKFCTECGIGQKMNVNSQIDILINKLENVKPKLSSDRNLNQIKFNNILTSALNYSNAKSSDTSKDPLSWVDENYEFDPDNIRKPNVRELMEALSGRTVEELYSDPSSKWQDISNRATELLYGVVGSNKDNRDWTTIMSSDNVLRAARIETGKLHNPVIDIDTQDKKESDASKQYAIIKDSNGFALRALTGKPERVKETLMNFGATSASIPANIESKITDPKFDIEILNILKNFSRTENPENPDTEKIALTITTKAIADRFASGIPFDELEKL